MRKAIFGGLLICVLFVLTSCASTKKTEYEISRDEWNTEYTYVFVHGLSGWGHYDSMNKFFPYWGMKGGSLMKFLNRQGIDAHDASVAPTGSAWDRACELYAQLTGTVTDYGKEHSERCNHERYGRDFSKEPLIEEWSAEKKINLLGHSFGGVTVRLLTHLMANGSAAEMEASAGEEISPLFTGGKGDWIYSVATLAAPHNGTSAYHTKDDTDVKKVSGMQKMMNKFTAPKLDGRAGFDYADFDMHMDHAAEINTWLKTVGNVYYFSYACNATVLQEDGTYAPDTKKMESLFQGSALRMGRASGISFDGIELPESWRMNDGLVNTVSALAPSSSPSKEYNPDDVPEGIWNVMPIYDGDHMSLQGGMKIKNDIKGFYLEHINMVNRL